MRTKQKKKNIITHIVKEIKLYLQIIQPSIYRILLSPLKLHYDRSVVFSDTRSILKVFFSYVLAMTNQRMKIKYTSFIIALNNIRY